MQTEPYWLLFIYQQCHQPTKVTMHPFGGEKTAIFLDCAIPGRLYEHFLYFKEREFNKLVSVMVGVIKKICHTDVIHIHHYVLKIIIWLLNSLTCLWLSNFYPFERMCNLVGVTVCFVS